MAFSIGAALFRRNPKHILLLSWVLPYFLITGSFDVKFMRYMLPITPFLAVMGASAFVWGVQWLRQSPWRLLRPRVAYVLLALTILFTTYYALAYVNIYTKPHPAEAASDWINSNVPRGSGIALEHWDEGLRRLEGYDRRQLELYNDETPAKRAHIIERLAEADYLVFYSNRLYGTIPRLPERYPMTREYYRLLFDGELGYALAHWETSYPNLYGLSFVDDTFGRPELSTPEPLKGYKQTSARLSMGFADESFTVYDHPLVLVFKKTLQGSPAEQRAFLDSKLPQPGQPRPAFDTRLLLSPEDAQTQQEGGTWSRIFNRTSFINKVPAVWWFLLVQLIFLLTLPITLVLFRGLPDRGYLLGKILGILLVAYIPWLLASLHWFSFSRFSIAFGMGLIALASAGILRFKYREILDFLRRNKRLIITGEALFLLSFLGFYSIRLWNPDLWQQDMWVPWIEQFGRGGEKPMDFAYFNAVVRSTSMPPYDPWFSGGYLNYYYFGQFMSATPTKLLGIVPSKAIILAVPLFFALTTTAAFSIAYNLSALVRRGLRKGAGAASRLMSPIWAGLTAVAFVAVIGNLDGIVQLSQGVGRVIANKPFGVFDFWRSSRMMPPDPPGFEVTEFPFFTFLFADPHAHLFVIPLTLLALGLALAFILGTRRRYPYLGRMAVLPFLGLGLTLGAILATNSWDVLTYATVGALAVLIAEYRIRRRIAFPFLGASAIKIAALGALSLLFFLPYLASYQIPIREEADSFVSSVPLLGPVANMFGNTFKSSETVTVLYKYMGIHGLFIVILFSFLAFEAWRRYHSSFSVPNGPTRSGFQARVRTLGWRWLAYIGGGAAGIAILAATGYATIGFLTGMLLLMAPLVLSELLIKGRGMAVRLFVYAIIALPLLLGILVDLLTFDSDIGRLNTVFKFYLQAWVLFALASAFALWRLRFGEAIPWKPLRRGWQAFVVLLVAAALIYPVMATPVRPKARFKPDTADCRRDDLYEHGGIPGSGPGDGAALGPPGDRMAPGQCSRAHPSSSRGSPPCTGGGTASPSTPACPPSSGWDHHQKQQRGDYVGVISGVDQRRQDVDTFYNTPDAASAKAFLERYGVRYIYVGQLERAFYRAAGLAKFDGHAGRHPWSWPMRTPRSVSTGSPRMPWNAPGNCHCEESA